MPILQYVHLHVFSSIAQSRSIPV